MNKQEQAGSKALGTDKSVESATEVRRRQELEAQITAEAAAGDFDRILTLSLERAKIIEDAEKRRQEAARKEALPGELRARIASRRERLAQIEDGSFPIPDADTREAVIRNLKEGLETDEEDLLIAEGAKLTYESQAAELRKEIETLIELYARRWEELEQSGDEPRILAFFGGVQSDRMSYPGKSPYEAAKWQGEVEVSMCTEFVHRPRSLRNVLLHVKMRLEEALSRSVSLSITD